jgi:hypothetical protein
MYGVAMADAARLARTYEYFIVMFYFSSLLIDV